MGDHSELQRLATRIVEVQTSQDVPISKLFDDFEAAACPETILALIAENDAARKELGSLRTDNAQLIYALKQQEQSYLVLRGERDRLRAEVAGLRTGYEAYERVNAELKAENEALVSAINEILRVTPMGVEAFGIAALVLGELSGAALGQGELS